MNRAGHEQPRRYRARWLDDNRFETSPAVQLVKFCRVKKPGPWIGYNTDVRIEKSTAKLVRGVPGSTGVALIEMDRLNQVEQLDSKSDDWMEKVSDEQYQK